MSHHVIISPQAVVIIQKGDLCESSQQTYPINIQTKAHKMSHSRAQCELNPKTLIPFSSIVSPERNSAASNNH